MSPEPAVEDKITTNKLTALFVLKCTVALVVMAVAFIFTVSGIALIAYGMGTFVMDGFSEVLQFRPRQYIIAFLTPISLFVALLAAAAFETFIED